MEWEECLVSGQVIVVEVEKERKRWHMLKKQQVQLDWCAGLGQLKPWLIGAKLALWRQGVAWVRHISLHLTFLLGWMTS